MHLIGMIYKKKKSKCIKKPTPFNLFYVYFKLKKLKNKTCQLCQYMTSQ